jgi:hypothetical protein
MRIILACLALASFAACSSSSTTAAPIPDGNWDVTLTFDGGGNCAGLPATFPINFDIATAAGGYTISAETGLSGDSTTGTIACTSTVCELVFSDTGPGSEFSNICTQTITATLDEDGGDNVTGNGQIDFTLTDGTACTATFDAAGDVAH